MFVVDSVDKCLYDNAQASPVQYWKKKRRRSLCTDRTAVSVEWYGLYADCLEAG